MTENTFVQIFCSVDPFLVPVIFENILETMLKRSGSIIDHMQC